MSELPSETARSNPEKAGALPPNTFGYWVILQSSTTMSQLTSHGGLICLSVFRCRFALRAPTWKTEHHMRVFS